MSRNRIVMAALSLSAAGFAALVATEGFIGTARSPVPGDVATVGFGSTRHADGTPVKAGETITPTAAVKLAVRDVAVKEATLKTCITVPLHQYEYDAYVYLSYNVGPAAVCRSSIPKKLAAGDYEGACKTILDFRRVQGRDCSLPQNARFCGGIWTSRQKWTRICLGQEAAR